jgi:hypothetical protein
VNVSLDYDRTYTLDPKAWDEFIETFQREGHSVYVVTMRYNDNAEGREVREALGNKADGIFFTGRKAKRVYMQERGVTISIWIDDMPEFILTDAK